MAEDGLPRERLQYLGQIRLHSLALAGSENHDGKGHGSFAGDRLRADRLQPETLAHNEAVRAMTRELSSTQNRITSVWRTKKRRHKGRLFSDRSL